MKIVTVVGARPQFIKAAVFRSLCEECGIEEILVHTGQHYDHMMSDIFFTELNIRLAEYKFDLKHRLHGAMTGEIMSAVETVLIKEKPDWCLVYGDTNSTLGAALAASKLQIPICHIEAGLRSFNNKMPEEINRKLTDHVSKILFCSTQTGVTNLKNEGIIKNVHHVGDIMFDAVKAFKPKFKSEIFQHLDSGHIKKPRALITLHRAETINDPVRLKKLIEYASDYSKNYSLIFPLHPNTKNKCREFNIALDAFKVIEPQPYLAMQRLLSTAELVLTDSGGLQKEAYFHNVRCVTLRDETEWVETINHGWNRLWKDKNYRSEPTAIPDYGDGHSAQKMLSILDRVQN